MNIICGLIMLTDDVDICNELKSIYGNYTKIEELFHQNLSFGTGGLRGIIGAGTNIELIFILSLRLHKDYLII